MWQNWNLGSIFKYNSRLKLLWNSFMLDIKIQILTKQLYPGQNLGQFWSKIQILVKNSNSGENLQFWSKIQIFLLQILVKISNSGRKFKFFWANSGQKFKFWSKIQILIKNSNSGQKFKFWWKSPILVENSNFFAVIKYLLSKYKKNLSFKIPTYGMQFPMHFVSLHLLDSKLW